MAHGAAAADGRIAFRIRIGVTGHRSRVTDEVVTAVREQLRRIVLQLPVSAATPVRLAVVSALAEGADRVVVREVLTAAAADWGHPARLEAVLPMATEEYARAQGLSNVSRAELDQLLLAATVAEVGQKRASDEISYEQAGRRLVGRCDVLLALWNGRETGGRGSTAETLLYAASRGKQCIWISTEAAGVKDNLLANAVAPFFGEVLRLAGVPAERAPLPPALGEPPLDSLQSSFALLDEFNRDRLPRAFARKLADEFAPDGVDSRWGLAAFTRATLLAERYQRLFRASTWLMSALATSAAALLATGLVFRRHSAPWAWAEFACLVALAGVFITVRRLDFHRRWLSYRLLAERLRSAIYLASTGVDFRRVANLDPVHVEHRSADWLSRAFEEIWDERPRAANASPPGDDEELKRRLADEWLSRQIRYHADAARGHRRWELALATATLALFAATIVFALLHALEVQGDFAAFLLTTLPVAGASLGALLTLRQHRALSVRSSRMQADLAQIRQSVLEADAETIGEVASEGARVIAEESGDWLGAMWFLDVEHPP